MQLIYDAPPSHLREEAILTEVVIIGSQETSLSTQQGVLPKTFDI